MKQPTRKQRGAYGAGHVFERHGAWYLQYYQNGERMTVQLAPVDREHSSATCRAVRLLRQKHMMGVTPAPRNTEAAVDMKVVDYWEQRFLPYCEEVLQTGPRSGQPRKKPTTIKDYRWVWSKFLKDHFGTITLQRYQPHMAERFLDSLTAKRGWHVLRHIRTVGSAIFKRALKEKIITINPWSAVEMPEDVIRPEETPHYTREQSEDLVSALVDHVDAQLVLSLACFLALGPAEIAGLRWEDIDQGWVNIRRNVVLGKEGTTKTIERAAPVPILDEVRVPLELWRRKCDNPSTGWLFGGKPIDIHNLVARVIRPHVDGERYGKACTRCKVVPKASRVEWRGMYTARRGAITHAINVTGNIPLGQRLARHKDAATTTAFYHKTMPDSMFLDGMKRLNGKRD